ncbi:MAG: hypothetical protein HPY75_12070 [Actinobacteria bacterium]|nr:hypothetical protein [Actinomycetota bacterium]
MADIAVLGWDHLVGSKGALDLREGAWREDGPELPVELAHITSQRALVPVLCRSAGMVRVLWAYMGTETVGEAVWNLSQAEGSKPENVGFVDLTTGEYWCRTVDERVPDIRAWAEEKNAAGERIDVVIWNDLKPNFEKKARRELNAENVVAYLKSLKPEFKERAREYLEMLPERARTSLAAAVRERWDEIW